MVQWILKVNCNVVQFQTLRPLSVEKTNSYMEAKKCEIFDALIKRRWGNAITPLQVSSKEIDSWEEYHDDELPW